MQGGTARPLLIPCWLARREPYRQALPQVPSTADREIRHAGGCCAASTFAYDSLNSSFVRRLSPAFLCQGSAPGAELAGMRRVAPVPSKEQLGRGLSPCTLWMHVHVHF